jgi:hypothetical protein
MPVKPVYEWVENPDDGTAYLLVSPEDKLLTHAPDPDLIFTIENPVRLKRFLDIQLESAEALKDTNEKISALLSEENIESLGHTVRNTEQLTARATEVLDGANELIRVVGDDLNTLVTTTEHLADNLIAVTDNLNDVIGDESLKADIISTVDSIESSASALQEVVSDPALTETIHLVRDTTADASMLVSTLKKTAKDRHVQERLDRSLTLFNTSLDKLSRILNDLDEAVGPEEDNELKAIVDDTKETTENLKSFSEKLNKRFLLFRLLF